MRRLALAALLAFIGCSPAYAEFDTSPEAVIARQQVVIDSYMDTQVMRCDEGNLVIDIQATADAGEPVYLYDNARGCRYMLLPEPVFGVGLMFGIAAIGGVGSHRSRRQRHDPLP